MKPPIGKVLLYCSSDTGDPADCVSWAQLALENGIDSSNLRILSGLDKPFNSFEVRDYTQRALHELNIEVPSVQVELLMHETWFRKYSIIPMR